MNKTILFTSLWILTATSIAANPTPSVTLSAASSETTSSASTSAPQNAALTLSSEINCRFHIPPTTTIPPEIVRIWAEKAILQTFDYDHQTFEAKLREMQHCFTDQGFQGYKDALVKSGNMAAVKTQKLSVSSQVEGTPHVTSLKNNQWSVRLPVQVVYQNDKEKLTQKLSIEMLIARKANGDLGIVQIIAAPRNSAGKETGVNQ